MTQLGAFDTSSFTTANTLHSLVPTTTIQLAPLTRYWVVVAPNDFNFALWNLTTANTVTGVGTIPDLQAISNNGGASFSASDFNVALKFAVNATAVPEPGTMALFLAGAVAWWGRRRYRAG